VLRARPLHESLRIETDAWSVDGSRVQRLHGKPRKCLVADAFFLLGFGSFCVSSGFLLFLWLFSASCLFVSAFAFVFLCVRLCRFVPRCRSGSGFETVVFLCLSLCLSLLLSLSLCLSLLDSDHIWAML